jgi:hypothetical protein
MTKVIDNNNYHYNNKTKQNKTKQNIILPYGIFSSDTIVTF